MRCDVCDVSLKSAVWWPIGRAISRCDAMFAMYRSSLPSGDQLAGRYRDAMQCCDVLLKSTIWWPIGRVISRCDAMFAMYRSSLPSGDQLAGRRPWSASWQQHTRWSNWRQLVLIDIWSSLTDIPSEVQTFFEMIGLETLTHFYFCVCGDLYCEDLEQTNTKSKTVQNKS